MNSIQVFQDQENTHGMQTRGAKRADGQNQAVKRTALGQVTNLRQQPARAAKVSKALLRLCLPFFGYSHLSAIVKYDGLCIYWKLKIIIFNHASLLGLCTKSCSSYKTLVLFFLIPLQNDIEVRYVVT